MCLQISDVPPRLHGDARTPGEPHLGKCIAHGATAGAVARSVDVGFGHLADIGARAEKMAEMSLLVAPAGNLDGALHGGIRVENPRGLERVDDAERAIEPAGVVLALQVRTGQQFRPGLGAGSENVADAVDRPGELGLGELLDEPFQRELVRLRKGRLVHAGLVGAKGAQRMEIGEHALSVGAGLGVRHVRQP